MGAGILGAEELRAFLNPPDNEPQRIISLSGCKFDHRHIKESSIDLPLGSKYWRMKGSCRTGGGLNVTDMIRNHGDSDECILGADGITLDVGRVYLFEVGCRLNLPDHVSGKATGRSSIGRLDVLVRLLIDRGDHYDTVPKQYDGTLFVEVTPISFPLHVKTGTSLSQLRLYRGPEHLISVTKEELDLEEEKYFPIVDKHGDPDKSCLDKDDQREVFIPFHLDLTKDEATGISAFRAKKDIELPIDPTCRNEYQPQEFWEAIQDQETHISLDPDRLYILRSKERLRIPGHLALECKSYTESMGEWRIEYAGFAHPWFGFSRTKGTPIIFEVRGHNVPTVLTHGIPLGNVAFKRMSKSPKQPDAGDYEEQELKLSKCFAPWPE